MRKVVFVVELMLFALNQSSPVCSVDEATTSSRGSSTGEPSSVVTRMSVPTVVEALGVVLQKLAERSASRIRTGKSVRSSLTLAASIKIVS